MPDSPTRHRVAVVLALVGVAVSILTLHETQQLESVSGYTSFCNLGGVVNCDAVLTSRWSKFLGLPVSLWAIAVFALGALCALPGAMGATTVGAADLALIALASGSLGFGLVMAGVSSMVLRTACLLCMSLYAVILAWFITVLPLARRFQASDRAAVAQRRSSARAAIAAGLLAAVGAGALAAVRTPKTADSVAEVKAADPKFFEVYTQLPVVDPEEAIGPAPHVKGAPNAPLTIVEFSDFECPACGHAFGDLRELVRSRPDVRLVFRHFPLDSQCNAQMQQQLHPEACKRGGRRGMRGKARTLLGVSRPALRESEGAGSRKPVPLRPRGGPRHPGLSRLPRRSRHDGPDHRGRRHGRQARHRVDPDDLHQRPAHPGRRWTARTTTSPSSSRRTPRHAARARRAARG